MANDPLAPNNILQRMADALPSHKKDDPTSDISSSFEVIALFSHACMAAVEFRLLGLGEGQKQEAECRELAPRIPENWNSSVSSYSFLYAHPQSSMQFVVKVDRLGGKAEIRGIGLGDEKITRVEIVAKDYVSSATLPLRIAVAENGEQDRSTLVEKLKAVFTSPSRIQDLATLLKIQIIQKLVPSLQKEGYEETNDREIARDVRDGARAERNQEPRVQPDVLPQPARPHPFDDPLATGPRRPFPEGDLAPPGFDDEYDLNRPLRGMAPPFPGAGSPFGIGHDDLNPPGLGPHDPLRGSFVGGGGLGGFRGGGGMHPTFDDPLFRGSGQQGGYDPRAPPGSRYDPIGPGDRPPQGSGGRPPNPFGGFGDNDFI